MKQIAVILMLCVTINATSQKNHTQVLNMTKEIKIIDRVYLDIPNLDKTELDNITAHRFFKNLYGTNNPLPVDTKYYISGKITKHPDFDLLLLYSEKHPSDSLNDFNLLLLTTRKDGSYISSLDAASDIHFMRNNKMQSNRIRSYLYSDMRIKQENEISAMNRKFQMEYRINEYGVFVSYPKYKAN
jgi:hypothetical protein